MEKPTEARKAELKAWVYRFFRETWDRQFTPASDVQSKLLTYFIRDNISDEALETFESATKAWVRYYQDEAKKGTWVKLPCANVWYNEHRYDNPIPSVMESRAKADLAICSHENCNMPVHGPRFTVCSHHIPNNHDERLRAAWIRTGITKKDPDYREQCRAYCRERFNILMVGK